MSKLKLATRTLSKSKLIAYRQCPKRLWLEIHRPDLRQDSSATQASFNIGFQVGDIAQQIYDPTQIGHVVDIKTEGFTAAFTRTTTLLESNQPIFEAGFSAAGALAFADVMLPVNIEGQKHWRMIEVKSSTSVKGYHRDDSAIQAYIAKKAGVPLAAISLAHIDSSWVYQGDGDYQGLLVEYDLTNEAFSRNEEVMTWIAAAQAVSLETDEPLRKTGRHCGEPFECGFLKYCQSQEPQAEYPVRWLPRVQAKALKAFIAQDNVIDIRNIPDKLLTKQQQRVKTSTLSKEVYFNANGAAADLAEFKLPAYFLDFETIQFAVPIWKGTRPYQQITFQFSLHHITEAGEISHHSFLDLSGNDPSEVFAKKLIEVCGTDGAVFVYNAGFEKARIRELADRLPDFRLALLAINKRIVDLLPIARQHYYHPSQHGSWSIKKVLPAVAPDLSYGELEGVQDGGMAMTAFLEAISTTDQIRKNQIEQQLIKYCELDTFAMVRLWQFFSGNSNIVHKTKDIA